MKAVVIGGGLAGITAAVALAKAGHEVTLLEAKPKLGGATMSFTRDGLVIDTGQHVFLRCCTAYRGLLDRLGMTAHAPLQPRFDVTVVAPGKRAAMRRRHVPAPFHMLPALLGYPFLNLPERLRLSLAAQAFRRLDPADPETDETRLGDWLRARGQDERTRRVLWDLFSVSSLNVPGDDASLALAAVVVQTGLLGKADAADIGVPALPLGELHGAAASRTLAKLGAEVRFQAKVASVEPKGDRYLIRLARSSGSGTASGPDATGPAAHTASPTGAGSAEEPGDARDGRGDPGGVILADAVVLAVPHEQAAKLIPRGALPAQTVGGWAGLGAAPIVNVHVIYDRKVMDVPFAAAVDSPVQWVFDRTRISGMHARGGAGQYLALSQSAADEYANLPVARLREIFLPALEALFPAARQATVTEFFVTREKRATFRQVPGTAKLRPKAGTNLPGLVLAGSWTDTGWPDTMEGAVRSGLNAVIALHEQLSPGATPRRTPGSQSGAGLAAGRATVSGAPGTAQGAASGSPGSGQGFVPGPPDAGGGSVPGSPGTGQSPVPGPPRAGEGAVSGLPEAGESAGPGLEVQARTLGAGEAVSPRANDEERSSPLLLMDQKNVNNAVNSSAESGIVPGINFEISGLEAGREAVSEVTEENKQVNIEADEREVRS